jgi:hypothetical protein
MSTLVGQWKVKYSVKRDQDRGRIKQYDGKMVLWAPRDWIVLLDARGSPIGRRTLNPGEDIFHGSTILLPMHVVLVEACEIAPMVPDPRHATPADSATSGSLDLGLDLEP